MCLVHSNLEKMLEKILPDHQAEEWGGTTAGNELGAGEEMQGCIPCRDAGIAGMFSFP